MCVLLISNALLCCIKCYRNKICEAFLHIRLFWCLYLKSGHFATFLYSSAHLQKRWSIFRKHRMIVWMQKSAWALQAMQRECLTDTSVYISGKDQATLRGRESRAFSHLSTHNDAFWPDITLHRIPQQLAFTLFFKLITRCCIWNYIPAFLILSASRGPDSCRNS